MLRRISEVELRLLLLKELPPSVSAATVVSLVNKILNLQGKS